MNVTNSLPEWWHPLWDRLAEQPVIAANAVLAGLGSLAAVTVSLLGWICWGDDIAAEALQAQRLRSRLAQQRQAPAEDLAMLRRQQADLAEAVSALEWRWADPSSSPALWLQVEAAALAHALKVESFQPAAPVVLPDRVDQSGTLRLKGRYAQLLGWANTLADSTPAVGVRRLSLQPTSDGLLLADITLVRGQRLASANASPRPAHLSQTPSALSPGPLLTILDPFAEPVALKTAVAPLPPAPHRRRPDPLQAWPLSELRLAGVMVQSGQAVALVQVAGRVHAVHVGDGLGQDQGQVQRIDEGGLVLREWLRQPTGAWTLRDVRLAVGQRAAP